MRILFSTYSLAFQNPGGGEQVLLQLQKGLQEKGHQVDLYNPWQHDLKKYNVIHYFSCLENSFWSHAKKKCPNTPLVVTPTIFFEKGLVSRFKNKKHFLLQAAERKLLYNQKTSNFRLPNHWLPVSQAEAQNLCDFLDVPKKNLSVLPNGCNIQKNDPQIFRKKFHIEDSFFLHVGRLHPVKNHFALIEAAAKAQVQLVCIGKEDLGQEQYAKKCKNLAAEKNAFDKTGKTRISFLGEVANDHQLLASAYSGCAGFVMPSLFETFGIAALEAFFCDAPLILSETLGLKDFVKDDAIFVPPNDIHALAKAMSSLASKNPQPASSKNHQRLKDQLSWYAISSDLVDIYERLLK